MRILSAGTDSTNATVKQWFRTTTTCIDGWDLDDCQFRLGEAMGKIETRLDSMKIKLRDKDLICFSMRNIEALIEAVEHLTNPTSLDMCILANLNEHWSTLLCEVELASFQFRSKLQGANVFPSGMFQDIFAIDLDAGVEHGLEGCFTNEQILKILKKNTSALKRSLFGKKFLDINAGKDNTDEAWLKWLQLQTIDTRAIVNLAKNTNAEMDLTRTLDAVTGQYDPPAREATTILRYKFNVELHLGPRMKAINIAYAQHFLSVGTGDPEHIMTTVTKGGADLVDQFTVHRLKLSRKFTVPEPQIMSPPLVINAFVFTTLNSVFMTKILNYHALNPLHFVTEMTERATLAKWIGTWKCLKIHELSKAALKTQIINNKVEAFARNTSRRTSLFSSIWSSTFELLCNLNPFKNYGFSESEIWRLTLRNLKDIVSEGGDMDMENVVASWKRQSDSKRQIATKADTSVFDEDAYFVTQNLNNDQTRHLWLVEIFECMPMMEGKLWAETPSPACDGFSCAGRLIQVITNNVSLGKDVCEIVCEGIDSNPRETEDEDVVELTQNAESDNNDREADKSEADVDIDSDNMDKDVDGPAST
ncbi:unnamed protein product [Oikopleura dioica]|uniref:Uncharacterized protein n=1 Tax=Oikopleura dioica TaxID=34765 RepID=E4XLA1_OIKDI|nr:unnamed protein product [Oikopleura dioica]